MPDALERLRVALAERYKVERELGRGGMATVYLAQDLKHRRAVAIKLLRPELAVQPARFLREIAIAAQLQHPHILPLYDSGQSDELLYYVMPYVEGESLRDRLSRERQLPFEDVLRIGQEVASALAHAHGRNVVHRDIKPENILLSGGEAVVADFGIARALTVAAGDTRTETGLAIGTPAYMSPEQAAGDAEIDGRADVYSLGCVLYEMVTGGPPFTGSTAQQIISRRFRDAPPPMLTVRAGVPDAVDRLIATALAVAPNDRFASAAAFGEAMVDAARYGSPTPPHSTASGQRPERSIAVLPFVNMSADPDNDYFGDGISEELINALTKVAGLRVVSRTSAFAFKGRQEDVRAIGRHLGAGAVLEGSIRKAAKRVRITAQLIAVNDGYHLWSEVYDREMSDVFAVQDEISRSIVGALRVKLLGDTAAPLVKKTTDNVEAYTLYLRGRYHWNRRTEADLLKSLDYVQQALAKDPEYALAYIGLADSYNILGFYSWLAPRDAFPRAKAAAEQALTRDPTLAAAYCSRGYARFYHEWDWAGAEQDFLKAIALDPTYATAPQFYGNLLAQMGRADESIAAMQRAIVLDPLSLIFNAALGWAFYHARRLEEAVTQLRSTTELDAGFMLGHLWLGQAYAQMGRLDEAAVETQRAIEISGRSAVALAALGRVHAMAGRRDAAQAAIAELDAMARARYVPQYNLALIFAALGDADSAFARLERAFADRAHGTVFLKVDPALDGLRADPRFMPLARRVGL